MPTRDDPLDDPEEFEAEFRDRTRSQEYKAYMLSNTWSVVRQAALDRHGPDCRDCGAQATEVHHEMYPEKFGDEDLDDLIPLCRACHQTRHEAKRQDDQRQRIRERLSGFRHYPDWVNDDDK